MERPYHFIIKDKKYGSFKKLASFIFLINATVFIIIAIRSGSVSNQIILFAAAFILIAYSIYNWSYKKKREGSYIIAYLLVAIIWITDTPFWFVAIAIGLLGILQLRMESDFSITLSNHEVIVNGFSKRRYNWPDLNNIILKDNLLTLDFKTNRVLQVEPDWSLTIAASTNDAHDWTENSVQTEHEFNDFCRQQLANRGSQIADRKSGIADRKLPRLNGDDR